MEIKNELLGKERDSIERFKQEIETFFSKDEEEQKTIISSLSIPVIEAIPFSLSSNQRFQNAYETRDNETYNLIAITEILTGLLPFLEN